MTFHIHINDPKVQKVLEIMGWTVECTSPLELSDDGEGFAKYGMVNRALENLIHEIAYVVIDTKVDQWHASYDNSVALHEFLKFSVAEYQAWMITSHAPTLKIEELIDAFIANPELYKDNL